VHVVEASAREAALAQESIVAVVRDAEDWASLSKREARERVLRVEAESTTALASAHGEVEDLAQRVALLEGELAEARQSQDTTKEKSQGLTNVVADAEWWLEESKRECRGQVEELTLHQTRDFELCLAIVGSLRVRSHLLEGIQVTALHHTEMAGELAAL
jgi:hypothetical protein